MQGKTISTVPCSTCVAKLSAELGTKEHVTLLCSECLTLLLQNYKTGAATLEEDVELPRVQAEIISQCEKGYLVKVSGFVGKGLLPTTRTFGLGDIVTLIYVGMNKEGIPLFAPESYLRAMIK
jgi:hypothetical protein